MTDDNKRFFDPKGLSLADEVKHELSIILTDDLCAFFAIAYTCRPLGDDYVDIVPTIIEVSGRLTKQERLKVAAGISELAKSIRSHALSDDEKSTNEDGE